MRLRPVRSAERSIQEYQPMQTQSRPRWYKTDLGLAGRMMLTMFLLGALYIAFILVLNVTLHVGLIPLILIAAVLAGIQFFFADKIRLMLVGEQIVDEAQGAERAQAVCSLAAR